MREPPAIPLGPVITLVYRVAPARRRALLDYLREAFPIYERPGGVRVALYESVDDPGLILELVAYADEATYAEDQRRVDSDPELGQVLAGWRALVDGPVEVRRFAPLSI